ncbi:uncharacterized protein LOC108630352, partial [Ceratina calcarata]|uniref:Uncharacterized protein LOC108630352 n=1 Tax=Ceratina calcarata TaxID=156304 RepID=A0AAJ7NCY5_9HYME
NLQNRQAVISSGEKTTWRKVRAASVIVSFIGKFRTRRVRSKDLVIEMYLTPATLYALRLSFQQGAVSSVFRKNMVERNITTSAFILATVGLSMSIFSVRKMLSSKHHGHL